MAVMASAMADQDDQRWLQVRRRDRSASSFVYAVKTTCVFCRSGCSSRLPRRENVVFFDDAVAAKAAGFRACLRCRPDTIHPVDGHAEAVRTACKMIDKSQGAVSLSELAASVDYSPAHFHRMFKRMTGVTPKAYASMRRTDAARALLKSESSVAGAIYASGYSASSRFYDAAAKTLGMTPSEYRQGAERQTIHVAIGRTDLGWVLIAATARGVCAIELADDERRLIELLRQRFPKAAFAVDNDRLQAWVAEFLACLEMPARSLALPLDVRGTAFQRRVWEALQKVPCGSTTTYATLARAIGEPNAARAVARACAANRLAVAIPCHRVVRTDGEPGGYRWGADRKQALLDREGSARSKQGNSDGQST